MKFIKKIKVSRLNFVGIAFFLTISMFSSLGQCGISVPNRLVYIGLDPISTLGNQPSQIVSIPFTVKPDSLSFANSVVWTSSNTQIIPIVGNIPQVSIGNYGSQFEVELSASCPSSVSKHIVTVVLLPAIHPRNAVTGNSDSVNDFWDIINLEKYNSPLPIVKVFDRWGSKVFESKDGYRLHKFNGIDSNGGKFLTTGTYVYSIIPHPDYPEVLGELTLIR